MPSRLALISRSVHCALFLASCDDLDRTRDRVPADDLTEPREASVAPHDPPGLVREPGVTYGEPVADIPSQWPGVRLFRIERARGGAVLPPFVYGVGAHGERYALRDVLLHELARMSWVSTPYAEGNNLVLWRASSIFEPAGACVYRDPVHTEPTGSGRVLVATARCGSAPPRTVRIEILRDYSLVRVLPR